MSAQENMLASLPTRLYPRRAPFVVGFGISLMLIYASYAGTWTKPWQNIFLLAFWGVVGVLSALAIVFGGRAYLELSTDGFVLHGYLRETRVKWRAVDDISVKWLRWPWIKQVVWRYADPPPGRSDRFFARGFNGRYYGGVGGNYGMRVDDLAALMNDLRQHYGGPHPGSPTST